MIVLSVLKIVGTVLLIALLLLLILALLVLFVPISYWVGADVDWDRSEIELSVRVTWLLRLIAAGVDASPRDGVSKGVYAFGIRIYPRKTHGGGDDIDELPEPETEGFDEDGEKDENVKPPSKPPVKPGGGDSADVGSDMSTISHGADGSHQGCSNADDDGGEANADTDGTPLSQGAEESASKGGNLLGKVRSFAAFISRLIKKSVDTFKNLGYTMRRIYGKIRKLSNRLSYYMELLEDERTIDAIELLKLELLRVIKSVRPRKWELSLHFGFEDPADTGETLGKICALCPFYGSNVIVNPDFDRTVFDVNFWMKGRITIFTFVIVLWKLYFNKNLKRVIRRFRHYKGGEYGK